MQKMMDLRNWRRITNETTLPFPSHKLREVKLHVNAPYRTLLLIEQAGELHFLAAVEGRDEVSVDVDGDFSLTVDGPECFVYTTEGSTVHVEHIDAQTFTKVAERRRISPEMAMMQRLMNENRLAVEQARAEAREARRLYEDHTAAAERSAAEAAAKQAADGKAAADVAKAASGSDGGSNDGGTAS